MQKTKASYHDIKNELAACAAYTIIILCSFNTCEGDVRLVTLFISMRRKTRL